MCACSSCRSKSDMIAPMAIGSRTSAAQLSIRRSQVASNENVGNLVASDRLDHLPGRIEEPEMRLLRLLRHQHQRTRWAYLGDLALRLRLGFGRLRNGLIGLDHWRSLNPG